MNIGIRNQQRSSYRLLGLVGNGQFGRVYCGVHRKTGQLVALKYLQRHSLPTHAFLRELRCLLSLAHPNIVACYAVEHCRDGRRLVLEYGTGGTLRSHMLSPLKLGEILKLSFDILRGLAHAHQQGIVHCDIKPENILLGYHQGRWRAKISDFGIAKLIQEQSYRRGAGQTGSPAYMAPERFFRQYSPAADVYAVGVILFELLVGQRPFRGTPAVLQSAHLHQKVPHLDPSIEILQPLISKALEKLPARRYPTAVEMLADLEHLAPALSAEFCSPSYHFSPLAYSSHGQAAVHSGPQPLGHIQPLPTELSPAADKVHPWLMSHGSQLATLEDSRRVHVCQQVLDSPIQGIYPTKTGVMVATHRALWCGLYPKLLTPLMRWSEPALIAVDQNHRWAVGVVNQTKQLTLTHLRKPNQVDHPIRRPLPPDLAVHQVIAVDGGHFAIVSQSPQNGTQLQFWNRRSLYLTTLDLGITLCQFTSTRQRHQWLALDRHAPETVILLGLKPLRMTRLNLDICPVLMLDLPWGYLFADKAGKILLLDRDFHPIGGIQGPAGITAIASLNSHDLLVATWQKDTQGQLYCLNLQEYDLDMIF